MISPGQWHLQVPRDKVQNVRFRLFVLRRAKEDPAVRAALWHICSQDVLFWINVFAVQFNPDAEGTEDRVGPFITFPAQEDAIRAMISTIAARSREDREDVVIEKSRDMGASWLCLLIMFWMMIFHANNKFLVVSRHEDAVDNPSESDSLFWKLDFILQHMPEYLKPKIQRKKLHFVNADNNSSITGSATTDAAGVGGRATAMFVDEFSRIRQGYEILDGTTDTTGCRIFNFTHTDTGSAAHALITGKNKNARRIKKIVLHWSMHPMKGAGLYFSDGQGGKAKILDTSYKFPDDYKFILDGSPSGAFPGYRSPWYDAEEMRRTARDRAMNLDIDPLGTSSQFFDPFTIRKLTEEYAREPYWQGEVIVDFETGKFFELRPDDMGPLSLWCLLDPDGRPHRGRYVIAGDLSIGSGATPSCLSILSVDTGEKVGSYIHSRMDQKQFACVAVSLCNLFCTDAGIPAKLGWEMPGGTIFGQRVLDLGFRHIYKKQASVAMEKREFETIGWYNNGESMKHLLADYKNCLQNYTFINRCKFALEECLHFNFVDGGKVEHDQYKMKNDPSGARENHGDRTVADAIACHIGLGRGMGMVKEAPRVERIPVNSVAGRRQDALQQSRPSWW